MRMRQAKKILKANGMIAGWRDNYWHVGDDYGAVMTWVTRHQVKRYVKSKFQINPWFKQEGLTYHNSLPDVDEDLLYK